MDITNIELSRLVTWMIDAWADTARVREFVELIRVFTDFSGRDGLNPELNHN